MDVCIRLPWLHPLSSARSVRGARRLGVAPGECGDADLEEGWFPDYPLAPAEAASYLGELRQLRAADLEGLRHVLGGERFGRELRAQGEWEALALFMGREVKTSPWELMRRHSQQILLWIWRVEEQWAEIAELERRCRQAEMALKHNFSEYDFATLPGRPAPEAPGAPDLWKVTVAHAAVFIPPRMPIWAEGSMAEELLERFVAAPMPSWGDEVAGFWASVSQVIQQSPLWPDREQVDFRNRLGTIYNENRLWLVLP